MDTYNTLIKVFTILYVCYFEFGIGPILWLYNAETMTDKGIGIAVFLNWTLTILIGLLTPQLMKPEVLNNSGTFGLFGGFCLAGFVFILIFIKETKGLSKDQC